MRTETVELTTLCLLHRGDEYLLQNRVKPDWKGYALPGGHVESGESIVKAAIREMQEETGLTIHNPKFAGIKQFPIEGGRYVVFLFTATEFEGSLLSSSEGKMEWIRKEDLKNLPTVNHLQELIDVMLSDTLSEFQYIIEDGEYVPFLY